MLWGKRSGIITLVGSWCANSWRATQKMEKNFARKGVGKQAGNKRRYSHIKKRRGVHECEVLGGGPEAEESASRWRESLTIEPSSAPSETSFTSLDALLVCTTPPLIASLFTTGSIDDIRNGTCWQC
ncbi:hypothetical protein RRG08_002127 [Elysia crispata]|uniref:Uncharacterized protein n=1 Tax=Elysia crispata TaxID=231223 RepID=A0AAE1D486_9GAST|nr:hypothetical protein RRG08_002127 [Elysia crispata]